jgi:hypothetical protein
MSWISIDICCIFASSPRHPIPSYSILFHQLPSRWSLDGRKKEAVIREKNVKKITKRTVDALDASHSPLWDTELKGFGVRVTETGRKVYFVRKRKGGRGTKAKYDTIDDHGVLTPDQGRERAAKLLRVIALGGDRAAERRAAKDAPTVPAFAEERFLPEHVDTKLKPSTAAEYRSVLNRIILPAIGNKRMRDVTHADATRLRARVAVMLRGAVQ